LGASGHSGLTIHTFLSSDLINHAEGALRMSDRQARMNWPRPLPAATAIALLLLAALYAVALRFRRASSR
jgi:hypothetical protein